jgi:hypothetical protein
MDFKVYSVEDVKLSVVNTKPRALYIRARGLVPTSGWTNPSLSEYIYIQPPPDGIWDFDFTAQPPEGIVLEVFTRIIVEHIWHGDVDALKGVRIHASTNQKVELLAGAPTMQFLDLRGGGDALPWIRAPKTSGESPFSW